MTQAENTRVRAFEEDPPARIDIFKTQEDHVVKMLYQNSVGRIARGPKPDIAVRGLESPKQNELPNIQKIRSEKSIDVKQKLQNKKKTIKTNDEELVGQL